MTYRYLLAPLAALLLAAPHLAQAQTTPSGAVGIGTTAPDASAALDIVSSSKGVLLPRVAAATSITSPASGLLVYQTGSPAGFYYNAGTAAAPSWQRLSPGDNLGNHTATQALNLNGQKLTGGGTNGLRVRPGGGVRIDTLAGSGQGRLLTVAPNGTLQASAPIQSQALASTAPAPQLVGSVTAGSGFYAVGVNAAGTRAYALGNGGLQAYDISGSGAPVALGSPATTPSGGDVAVNAAGTRACVLNTSNSTLQAFDVSGGSTPVALGSPVATGASPFDLALNAAGTRAYVVTGTNTLEVYDVSGSGAPVRLGSATTGNYPVTVALNGAGTRAYVATNDVTLEAYDVSGSGAPLRLGSPLIFDPTYNTLPIQVAVNRAGTRAYLTFNQAGPGGTNGLLSYDVSGGGAPVPLGNSVSTGNTTPGSIAVNGASTRAYVTTADNTLLTYDLSGGGVPVLLGSPVATNGFARRVVLNGAGTRAYVTVNGSLQVYSLGAAPTVVGITSDGSLGTLTLPQLADNLGNHTATQNLDLAGYQLVSGGSTGLALTSAGNAGLGTTSPSQKLEVVGNVKISGSGNGLTFADGSVQTSASSLTNLVGDVTSSGTTTTYNNVVPAAKGGAGAVNGILKANGSGTVSQAVAADFPTLNQSTTGNAATVTTNANLTGAITSTGNATTYNNVVPAAKGGAGSVSGILKADGAGTVSAAVAGTDYAPAAGSSAYVQNTTTPQASSNFNVSGAGTVGGLLTAGSASVSGATTVGGLLTAGSASVSGNTVVAGTLGLGTTAAAPATQKLDVRGNVRLGADGGSSATGAGQALEFVGPGFNTDPVGLYRTNPASDASELRVVVGDVADANDKFVVGRLPGTTAEGGIPTGTFTPNFTVRADGNVGVGTGTPTSTLQVAGSVAASIRTLSSGTVAATDYTVIVTGSVSLPAPDATNSGRLYHLLNGNTNVNTVTGTFRDASTTGTSGSFTLGIGSGSKGITVQSDGTQWWIVTRE